MEEQRFEAGTIVAGKYEVQRKLGAGGMGLVLAVRHRELGELYALKLMLPAAAASAAARERFTREAKAAAKLKSEHVARATDFGFLPDDGPPYMVLELLEGQNLAERLAADGPMRPIELARLMLGACKALREAHEEGIVHRDLKPSNLFVVPSKDGSERLKVLDFGIAKTMAQDAGALTKTATTMGSPFYMSPEQMRSAKSAEARSDIWSMGITMYELSTGRVPFIGETVTEVAILVIEAAVVSPKVHRPDLPDAFVDIVMRCLQKDPTRRYACVDDLAEDLAAFTGERWARLKPRDVVDTTGERVLDAGALGMANTALDPSSVPADRATSDTGKTIEAAPLSVGVSTGAGVAKSAAPPPNGAETGAVLEATALPGPRSGRGVALAIGGAGVAVVGLGVVAGVALLGERERPPAVAQTSATDAADPTERAEEVASEAPPSASAPVKAAPTPAEEKAYRDALLAILEGAKPGMQACYELASATHHSLSGKVTLQFSVLRDGVPKDFKVIPDEALPRATKAAFGGAVASCFSGVVASKRFPPSLTDAETQLAFAYVLEPVKRVAVAAKQAEARQANDQDAVQEYSTPIQKKSSVNILSTSTQNAPPPSKTKK